MWPILYIFVSFYSKVLLHYQICHSFFDNEFDLKIMINDVTCFTFNRVLLFCLRQLILDQFLKHRLRCLSLRADQINRTLLKRSRLLIISIEEIRKITNFCPWNLDRHNFVYYFLSIHYKNYLLDWDKQSSNPVFTHSHMPRSKLSSTNF